MVDTRPDALMHTQEISEHASGISSALASESLPTRESPPAGTEKDAAAYRLIQCHFSVEPGVSEIYRFLSEDESLEDAPIKLLEVSDSTFETGQVDVYAFGPERDIPFPALVAEVTPGEWEQIRQGVLDLPRGWDLTKAQRFVRTQASDARSG